VKSLHEAKIKTFVTRGLNFSSQASLHPALIFTEPLVYRGVNRISRANKFPRHILR
jgi:hypothetical protein